MEQAKRLVCINSNMFSSELVTAAMALTAHGSLCTLNPNATPLANTAALQAKKGRKGDKEKGKDKEKVEKEKEKWEMKLELSREFRCTHFPMVHALLQNPLRELISNVPPTVILSDLMDAKSNVTLVGAPDLSEAGGLLFLFDGAVPNYAQDDIEWQTAKMSVKLIVCNQNTGAYKLKNNRNDEGLVVMRRQTWQGKKALSHLPPVEGEESGKTIRAWRKHEYKLVQREKFYKSSADGSLVVDQLQRILDYPVLVHYFVKTVDTNRANRKRKSRESEESPEKEIKPPPSKLQATVNNNKNNGAVNNIGANNNNTVSANNNNNINRNANNGSNNHSSSSSGPLIATLSAHGGLSSLLPTNSSSFPYSSLSNSNNCYSIDRLDNSLSNLLDSSFDSLPEVELQLCHFPSLQIPLAIPLREDVKAKIRTYAPDGGAWEDVTKVILVVEGFPKSAPGEKPNVYSIRFADIEVPAHEAGPGVLEFNAPAHHSPGVVYFWAVCRPHFSSAVYSNPVPFFYYPSDEQGRLRLDFRGLGAMSSSSLSSSSSSLPTETSGDICNIFDDDNSDDSESAVSRRRTVVNRFKYYVRELDVSNNGLSELAFCSDLSKLHTLIADNNKLTSTSQLPYLPSLKTLSVNFNNINSLETFLDNLEAAFPNLTYLSLINNEACPYFSKLSHHYYNYRIYVISRLPNLLYLDSSTVTPEEQRHATCISSSSPSATSAISPSTSRFHLNTSR